MLRDEVVLVNVDDKEIGTMKKMDAHKAPFLHRAFSIFIYNSKGEILIQKRADNKYHSASLWANACCSHPRSGEDIKESAIERLKDEVGIKTDIDELFTFIYLSKYNDSLYEYELDHVFLGKYDGNIILNKEEASDYKWISCLDLKNELVNNVEEYATWFIIAAPRVMEYMESKILK